MDLWVEKTEDNYKRIVDAFHDFEMPIFDMTKEIFLITQTSMSLLLEGHRLQLIY